MVAEVDAKTLSTLENREPDKCEGWQWVPRDDLLGKTIFAPLRSLLSNRDHMEALREMTRSM
jgi:hypothetical protein